MIEAIFILILGLAICAVAATAWINIFRIERDMKQRNMQR